MATDRKVNIGVDADVSGFVAGMKTATAAVRSMHNEIDKTNDRTAWMVQGVLGLAPAFTTLGAGAVPVLSGLVTQMTVAAAAGGVMAMAVVGVGDGLEALNAYQLEPTAANMDKLNESMKNLGPAGAEFVRFLDSVGPAFTELRMTAREGMFPGITKGIEEFMDLMPRLDRIVATIAEGIGDLATDAGESLAGPRFREFFKYLEDHGKPILIEMGHTFGNFMDGLAAMIVAFGPVSEAFSSGFEDMSKRFADWAHGLNDSSGFREFLDYVHMAAPMALDFLGSLFSALGEIIQAFAVAGSVMLPGLTLLIDALGAIAASPLGPLIASVVSLTAIWGRLNALLLLTSSGLIAKASLAFLGLTRNIDAAGKSSIAFTGTMQGVAGRMGLLAFALTDLDDKAGLTNTTMLALAGSIGGPWGAAIGAGIGLILDFRDANAEAANAIERIENSTSTSIMGMKRDLELLIEKRNDWMTTPGTAFELDNAIASLQRRIHGTRIGAGGLEELLRGPLSDALGYVATSADEFADELADIEGLLSRTSSLIEYEQALDDLSQSIEENGNNWDVSTEKGRENLRNRDALVEAAISRATVLKEDGDEEGAQRILQRAIGDLGKFAGASEDARRKLEFFIDEFKKLHKARAEPEIDAKDKRLRAKLDDANRLLKLWGLRSEEAVIGADPREAQKMLRDANRWLWLWGTSRAEATLDADGRPASIAIDLVRRQLAYLDTLVSTPRINVVTTHSGKYFKDVASTGADGATIPKTGLPYADRHPYLLADGEEVISNRYGQADRNRALLKAINANRLADGGTIAAAYRRAGAMHATPSAHITQRVSFDRALVDLRYPNGEVHSVEMVARAVAREEIRSDRTYQRATGPRYTNRGRSE